MRRCCTWCCSALQHRRSLGINQATAGLAAVAAASWSSSGVVHHHKVILHRIAEYLCSRACSWCLSAHERVLHHGLGDQLWPCCLMLRQWQVMLHLGLLRLTRTPWTNHNRGRCRGRGRGRGRGRLLLLLVVLVAPGQMQVWPWRAAPLFPVCCQVQLLLQQLLLLLPA